MKDQDRNMEEKDLVKEDKIDLIDLIRTLWEHRAIIIKSVLIFTVVGIFVALFSKKEYTASTIMVPQIENPSPQLGGLSSLASLAGVNMEMNSGADAISPVIYPEIISSIRFQLEILNTEFLFDEVEEPISLFDYYMRVYKPGLFGSIKKYTLGLPSLILSAVRGEQLVKGDDSESGVIRITKDQGEVLEIIEESLRLEVNDMDGYLTLNSRFHQAFLSAQVAHKAQQLLQVYVTRFKIEKATAQLQFVEERYKENKDEFEEAQSKLAAFRDANKNISSEIMRNQEDRLLNEYQLAFDVYSELAKQLEQSMIKVKEETPVFSVINEVVVPIKKSKPKRALIVIIASVLGGVIGMGFIIGRIYIGKFQEEWKS